MVAKQSLRRAASRPRRENRHGSGDASAGSGHDACNRGPLRGIANMPASILAASNAEPRTNPTNTRQRPTVTDQPERPTTLEARREPPIRLLITAGPTHEPIDAVRYIGNRSSGRLGMAITDAAAHSTARAWHVTLLLGPTSATPPPWSDSAVTLRRFLTTADLQALLADEAPQCDVLIMAAAVADYRPRAVGSAEALSQTKLKRGDGALTIELEPTPDLLAGVAVHKRRDQVFIGFALEPASRLMESARAKLERKRLDLIVANPLETMDSPLIEATVLGPRGVVHVTQSPVDKGVFASRLLHLAADAFDTARRAGAQA